MNKIELGIAPIGWTNDDLPELGSENTFEQTISEMALAGFTGTEIGNKYPKDTRQLKSFLEIRGLQVASAWFSTFLTTKPFEETKVAFLKQRDFLWEMGAKVIVVSEQGHSIQGKIETAIFEEKPIFTEEQWSRLCQGLEQLGNLAAEKGMAIVYHHHMGTGVQTPEEINHLMKNTDPEPLSLDYVSHSGGLFMDMSIHDFDMARFLSGSEVTEVFVHGATLVNPKIKEFGAIDTAIISLKFANGVLGVIDNSREAVYGYDQQAEVFGSKGSARCENETKNRIVFSAKESVYLENPLHFFLERYNEAYLSEVQQFIHAIQKNQEVPCCFLDGIMAQRIAQAYLKSLQSGQAETVDLVVD